MCIQLEEEVGMISKISKGNCNQKILYDKYFFYKGKMKKKVCSTLEKYPS